MRKSNEIQQEGRRRRARLAKLFKDASLRLKKKVSITELAASLSRKDRDYLLNVFTEAVIRAELESVKKELLELFERGGRINSREINRALR